MLGMGKKEKMNQPERERMMAEKTGGTMTTREAGKMGGQKVRRLIKEGEEMEERRSNR